jgi:hypothetical protein
MEQQEKVSSMTIWRRYATEIIAVQRCQIAKGFALVQNSLANPGLGRGHANTLVNAVTTSHPAWTVALA